MLSEVFSSDLRLFDSTRGENGSQVKLENVQDIDFYSLFFRAAPKFAYRLPRRNFHFPLKFFFLLPRNVYELWRSGSMGVGGKLMKNLGGRKVNEIEKKSGKKCFPPYVAK